MQRKFRRWGTFIALLIMPLISALQFALPAYAQTADPACLHGMRVIGEQSIYLTHMGLFNHFCHSYQGLFEVEFTGPNDPQTRYLEAQNQDPTQNEFTIEPTGKFVLPDLASGKISSFRAKLHQGQYERIQSNPKLLDADVTVNVKRVLHFRPFNPDAALPPNAEYLLFGTNTEQMAAHLIATPPDYDQVISVNPALPLTDTQLASAIRLVLPDRPTPNPQANLCQSLVPGQKSVVRINGQPPDMSLEAESEYFLETSDYE
jgi:hypothetical protein